MRRIGQGLLWIGAAVGVATGLGVLSGFHPAGWSWIMLVGSAKLSTLASFGLMAGGAVALRLDGRERQRRKLSARASSLPTPAVALPRSVEERRDADADERAPHD